MIRYHSFYPWHKEGAYTHLMNEADQEAMKAVKAFNPYDLYSKSDGVPDVDELKVSLPEFLRDDSKLTDMGCLAVLHGVD